MSHGITPHRGSLGLAGPLMMPCTRTNDLFSATVAPTRPRPSAPKPSRGGRVQGRSWGTAGTDRSPLTTPTHPGPAPPAHNSPLGARGSRWAVRLRRTRPDQPWGLESFIEHLDEPHPPSLRRELRALVGHGRPRTRTRTSSSCPPCQTSPRCSSASRPRRAGPAPGDGPGQGSGGGCGSPLSLPVATPPAPEAGSAVEPPRRHPGSLGPGHSVPSRCPPS